jgi:large subunit ribosomal protein L17
MRHRNSFRRLNRSSSHRNALFRNLATSLFQHGRVKTTLAKAREIRRIAEKLITSARGGELPARRAAYSFLTSKPVVHKLFTDIAPRYEGRPGGYTRIVKLGLRASDAAEMAVIELIVDEKAPAKKAAKKPRATKAKKAEKETVAAEA